MTQSSLTNVWRWDPEQTEQKENLTEDTSVCKTILS